MRDDRNLAAVALNEPEPRPRHRRQQGCTRFEILTCEPNRVARMEPSLSETRAFRGGCDLETPVRQRAGTKVSIITRHLSDVTRAAHIQNRHDDDPEHDRTAVPKEIG